jgi:CRISPR-associated endonuclease Csy4
MDHYIDINILPDPEFPASTLMNALFNKLHKALFDLHSKQIGVSFPDYGKTLGLTLRLHGSESNLMKLDAMDWVGRMKDYCKKSAIQTVPSIVQYRTVNRQQDSKSNAKLKRILARQENGKRTDRPEFTQEDVIAYQKEMLNQQQKGPYLDLQSSKGQRYRRYIVFGQLMEQPVAGEFNQFGLSGTATIPWF